SGETAAVESEQTKKQCANINKVNGGNKDQLSLGLSGKARVPSSSTEDKASTSGIKVDKKKEEGFLPPVYEHDIVPQPPANAHSTSTSHATDRGDNLQASEEITVHSTTVDHTRSLVTYTGHARGEHMLTLRLLLVATVVTPWTLCNILTLFLIPA
ncbi:hypothetical protein U0070_007092, partial [Myodes glareolus]